MGLRLTLFVLTAALLLLLHDLDLAAFLRWYGTRFTDYYGPKLAFMSTVLQRAEANLPELPDDVYEAWDLATAFIVVVSVFHLIERLRVAVLAHLHSAPRCTASDRDDMSTACD
jgi:hypothetical protein